MQIYKFTTVLVLITITLFISTTAAGIRVRRQSDFIFPDSDEANQIINVPTRPPPNGNIIQQPQDVFGSPLPGSAVTTTTPIPTLASKTTRTPEFIRCLANCPTTSQYAPVCGSDQELYFNDQKLRCAQLCGSTVQMIRSGSCRGIFPVFVPG